MERVTYRKAIKFLAGDVGRAAARRKLARARTWGGEFIRAAGFYIPLVYRSDRTYWLDWDSPLTENQYIDYLLGDCVKMIA